MDIHELSAIIESVLFASGDPVTINRLVTALNEEKYAVEAAITYLGDSYEYEKRGIRLVRLEDSVQLCTRTEYAEYIRRVMETRRAPMLTQNALEVLAIIAYRQPVTRAYVEQIRGVDSTYTIASLVERALIEECGRLEVPGRPAIFRTTDGFLRVFGLASVRDLPLLPELDTAEGEQLTFGG